MILRCFFLIFALTLALPPVAHAATVDRVVRRFTFEERAAGNVEDVPMHWLKVEGPGLPHYVNGKLTTDQAHGGEYAFGYELNGGSLIYRYPAGQLPAHAGSHYRLRVMAKTHAVTHARAQMTAYFADAAGRAIRSSLLRSQPLLSTTDAWTPLDLDVAAPDGTAWLVVELGLVQSSVWRPSLLGDATVFEQDITGRAWFDDLTIAQVPHAQMRTSAPGNVFRRSEVASVEVELNDRLTDDLVGRLDVRDADGAAVYQRSGNFDLQTVGAAKVGRLVLPQLPAGWYRATVVLESHGTEVGRQTMAFVQMADDAVTATSPPDPRFGVVATALPFATWDGLPKLLPLLGAARVKLGVWTAAGDIEHVPALEFNRLIDQLQQLGITPTACLTAPPPIVVQASGASDLQQLLKAPADTWQPPLALMMSRYAGHLDRWQFGDDARAVEFTTDPTLRQAYDTVLTTMSGLFSPPDLAMPWPIYMDLPSPAPAAVSLAVPTDVLPEHLPLYVADALRSGRTNVSLTLAAPDADRYGRPAQLRDLAQRIGYALASKSTRIDLPLSFDDQLNQPTDTLLVQRTLMTTLANAKYQGRMPIGDDLDALLFDRGGEGILLAWTKSPQAPARIVPVMLGAAPRAVDLNGNVSPVLRPKSADGTTDIMVGPTPSLVIGIDGALARLRTSFSVDNAMVESSFKPHVRRLRFTNPYPTAIAGQLKLAAPAGWTVTPQSPTFNLAAGETYDAAVTIEFPYSSVAGAKPIDVAVKLDSGAAFKVPLVLRLGLGDLGVDSSAFRDGADVVVQQLITNYGTKPADYTAYAAFPGAARQERIVKDLAAGTTVIKRYRFVGVDSRGPKTIRSGVREIAGSRVLTDEVTLP